MVTNNCGKCDSKKFKKNLHCPSRSPDFIETSVRCLQFYRAPVDFKTAESICSVSSGHLASVHNAFSNNFIAAEAQKYFYNSWLGAETRVADNTNPLNWYWTDETPFNYQNYRAGDL